MLRNVLSWCAALGGFILPSVPASAQSQHVVRAYVTLSDASRLFSSDDVDPYFVPAAHDGVPIVTVDERHRYQRIDGFGAALTGSAAHALAALPDRGASVVADLFHRDTGIGLSSVRLTIGASDFSVRSYTYDDLAIGRVDPALRHFSLAADAEVLTVLREIKAASTGVRYLASPWTAPAWMKTSHELSGGRLPTNEYRTYAEYLVAYIRAMHAHGISIDALTVQNEPLLNDANPAMTFTAAQEATFVSTALGPALKVTFPHVNVLVYDGNWDHVAYARAVLSDPHAAPFISGTAFHCYAGNVEQMSDIHRVDPAKSIVLSECGGGAWSPNFGDNLRWEMRNLIIGGTVNWARSVLLWNLALDDTGGPTNGGCTDCRGVITVHPDGSVTRNVEYYVLEHIAKFVRPGALRIASASPLGAALPNVAFVNTDGSTVLIVLNDANDDVTFAVRAANESFRYRLAAGAVVTFRWNYAERFGERSTQRSRTARNSGSVTGFER